MSTLIDLSIATTEKVSHRQNWVSNYKPLARSLATKVSIVRIKAQKHEKMS